MPSLILIITLFLAADLATNEALAELDIQNILEALKLQLHQQQHKERAEAAKPAHQHYRDEDDDNSRFGSLKPQEVQSLIQEALQSKDEESVQNQLQPYAHYKKPQHSVYKDQAPDNLNVYALWQGLNNAQDNQQSDNIAVEKLISKPETERKKRKKTLKNYQDSYLDQLNELLSLGSDEDNKQQRYQSHKQHMQPNYLLGGLNYVDTVNRAETDLDKYSKVYVILNADAVNTSQNRNRLTDLVSSLLNPASSNQREHRVRQKNQRYKGFIVNAGSRKANGDDTDLDYKPKRSRAHDSGRTPIPYIRHRGDIYEKDS